MRSLTVALRALTMLACLVGIPALAISTSSWQEIAAKFQGVHWRALLGLGEPASSSPSRPFTSFSQAPPLSLASEPSVPPINPPTDLATSSPVVLPSVAPSNSGNPAEAVQSEMASIQQQLKRAGATYYLLETWGLQQQQAYRFCCRVAVNGNPDYVHCFEATTAEPLAAMREVLQRVQDWRKSLTALP